MMSVCGLTVIIGAALFATRTWLPARFPESFLAGVALGAINLYFIDRFVKYFTKKERKDIKKLIVSGVGLNAVIISLLITAYLKLLDALSLTLGFTLVLVVLVVQGFRVVKS
jgi:hypothetical protein